MKTPIQVLQESLEAAQQLEVFSLMPSQQAWVDTLIAHAEKQKAVLSVLITSLVKKSVMPAQDVRFHQEQLPNGYSGRTLDTQVVTPFMQRHFPRLAMRETGWLTRSLEQPYPYTLAYQGKIANREVKAAFLGILQNIEEDGASPSHYLIAIFSALLVWQASSQVSFAPLTRKYLPIQTLIEALQAHFSARYHSHGASRLPVLALYAVYEILMLQGRYRGKQLLPLHRHTTADDKSGALGDIQVNHSDGRPFEALEIKHGHAISPQIVTLAYEKLRSHPLQRYYILTTKEPNTIQTELVTELVARIYQEHGCEVIVNGLIPSLKYYLRLIDDPMHFVEAYGALLQRDYQAGTDIKQEHLRAWQALLAAWK